MLVNLSSENQKIATIAGEQRFNRRRKTNSVHRWNRNATDHNKIKEIESIGAEIAVSQFLNQTWVDQDTPDADGDIIKGIQVRHTVYATGRLLLHESDNNEDIFFLVTGNYPRFKIVGWIEAKEGKVTEFWKELQANRPCYVVPQTSLKPLESFILTLRE